MLLLSGVFVAMTLAVFTGYGVLAAGVRHRVIDRRGAVHRLRRVFAASFVGLGAKLAATTR